MSKSQLDALICSDAEELMQPADKLDALREKCREMIILQKEIEDLLQQTQDKKKELLTLQRQTLPDMMDECHLRGLDLQPWGNHSAARIIMKDYIHAVLPKEEPDRAKAIAWLTANGHGDLVKSLFEIQLREYETANDLERYCIECNIPYSRENGVHWATLTAWVKEMLKKKQRLPSLDLIGATIGRVVDVQEGKRRVKW